MSACIRLLRDSAVHISMRVCLCALQVYSSAQGAWLVFMRSALASGSGDSWLFLAITQRDFDMFKDYQPVCRPGIPQSHSDHDCCKLTVHNQCISSPRWRPL